MTKLNSLTAFFFLLCFVSHGLSRPISLKSASVSSNAAVNTAGKFGEEYWFHHPWLFAHPPLPANWPKKPWPFVQPPMPNGGYKWAHWPPMPEKQWPFAHSPFPCPWWPKKEEVAADEIEEAAVAAPPLAA